MPKRNVVIRSIETPDGLHCVDLFRRQDGRFGFAEYRRDPEDPSGWHPTGLRSEARRRVPWLAAILG